MKFKISATFGCWHNSGAFKYCNAKARDYTKIHTTKFCPWILFRTTIIFVLLPFASSWRHVKNYNTLISSRFVTKNINQLACNVSKVTEVPLTWRYLDPFWWSECPGQNGVENFFNASTSWMTWYTAVFHAQLTCSSKSAICARQQNIMSILKPLLPLQRKLSRKKLPRSLQNAYWTVLDDRHISHDEWVSLPDRGSTFRSTATVRRSA